jgi:hypothetical protein
VIIQDPALAGTTDDRGQITFSGPSIVRALTLTIGKAGFEAVTVADLNAANLTVYLYPNEQEPIVIEPGQTKVGTISGRVFGFKEIPGLPTGETVTLQARVNFTAYSIYSVPPYGGIPQGTPIEQDGGEFEFTTRFGSFSLYAMFGAYDSATDVFTPALMGLRRGIAVESEAPVTGQDVVLSTYLDQAARVRLLNPPLPPPGSTASYGAYVSLDLGGDGVIYLSQAKGAGTELVLEGLPSVSSSSLLFVGLASVDGGYPYSYVFRRQDGGVGEGVELGPFLPFTQIVSPPRDGTLVDGRIAWESPQEPAPALTELLIQTADLMPVTLWRVVLPGDASEIILPPELLSLLPQGEPLLLLMFTADSPRFAYDRFNFSQLSSGRWTRYTIAYTTFNAP